MDILVENIKLDTEKTEGNRVPLRRKALRNIILAFTMAILCRVPQGIITAIDSYQNTGSNYLALRSGLGEVHPFFLGDLYRNAAFTENFLKQYEQLIHSLAETYEVPEEALYKIAELEIGMDSQVGAFGLPKVLEQQIKHQINLTRMSGGDPGDFTPQGSHLGHSFGFFNIKPGLVGEQLIGGVKNQGLKQKLLTGYDQDLRHASAAVVSGLTVPEQLEVVAANVAQYRGRINQIPDANERLAAYLLTTSTFPSDTDSGVFVLFKKYDIAGQ